MKKFGVFFLLLGLLSTLMSCYVDVNPGYVAVRVHKRGSKAGVVETLGVGRHSLKLSADDFHFPTFKQNYVWTADRAESSPNNESITFPIEGLTINIDVGIEFSVIEEEVATIFSGYRKTLDEITDGPMRNYIRDAVLKEAQSYTSMEQFITNNSISNLISSVEDNAREYFTSQGIQVSKVYLVGAPRYPKSVTSSIEEKIRATQRAIQRENELREAEAESKKKVAEAEGEALAQLAKARAEAEANNLKQRTYTSAVLRAMWIEKWDGKLPTTVTGEDLTILMEQ